MPKRSEFLEVAEKWIAANEPETLKCINCGEPIPDYRTMAFAGGIGAAVLSPKCKRPSSGTEGCVFSMTIGGPDPRIKLLAEFAELAVSIAQQNYPEPNCRWCGGKADDCSCVRLPDVAEIASRMRQEMQSEK